MSKLLNPNEFGLKLYESLPPVYRQIDETVDFTLKKYLCSIGDGGFYHVIKEINELTELLDPEKIPAEVLPIAFKHYGLEIFNGIPEMFLRKLLPIIGEMYGKKGTVNVIEYLTSLVSGVVSTVTVDPEFAENYSILVKLELDYGETHDMPDEKQLVRIIREFVPFFCTVVIIYAYFYAEEGEVRGSDLTYFTNIKFTTTDTVGIRNTQDQFESSLNALTKTLNKNILLNEKLVGAYIPDIFYDKMYLTQQDGGELSGTESETYKLKQSAVLDTPKVKMTQEVQKDALQLLQEVIGDIQGEDLGLDNLETLSREDVQLTDSQDDLDSIKGTHIDLRQSDSGDLGSEDYIDSENVLETTLEPCNIPKEEESEYLGVFKTEDGSDLVNISVEEFEESTSKVLQEYEDESDLTTLPEELKEEIKLVEEEESRQMSKIEVGLDINEYKLRLEPYKDAGTTTSPDQSSILMHCGANLNTTMRTNNYMEINKVTIKPLGTKKILFN